MSKAPVTSVIRLRGVRHNNLKNFDLDLPTGRLIVVTGPSGSGKSSLAFDTLYAEGQRRYIETFSPYARQFFDRMDKPQVDSIQGIPPAIAIEQRNSVKSTRSTVGTMTEICDYMKLVWSHLARLYCRQCGRPVVKDTPQQIWESLKRLAEPEAEDRALPPGELEVQTGSVLSGKKTGKGRAQTVRESSPAPETAQASEVLITFQLPLSNKLSLEESLELIAKQGYQRLLVEPPPADPKSDLEAPEVLRIEEAAPRWPAQPPAFLTVIQDRIKLTPAHRARFVEACEQAYHFGKGQLTAHRPGADSPRRFSSRFHCAECDLEYREPNPALFSFNHPLGACPACRGFGRTITIDYDLVLPNRSRSLADGVVKPWQSGQSAECQGDLMKFCRRRRVPTDVPFDQLSPPEQDWVLNGDPDYGQDVQHEWPRAWYGVKGYFRWLESKAYKMHVRVLLSRYRAYQTCTACAGRRFQPEALLFKIPAGSGAPMTLADFYRLTVSEALKVTELLAARQRPPKPSDPLTLVLNEVRSRLGYLQEVGLGYLTLDRPTRTLSGGETERVNLTTCLGSRLVNTLFVLDEPSVGLHARDTARLVGVLQRLRQAGNTVVVVEHEASVIRAAEQIVDLGPGHGESGGHLVFQGTCADLMQRAESLTGQYLSGRKRIELPVRRPCPEQSPRLTLAHARCHNLKDLTVEIPLGRFVAITGVSGSGKTTLIRDLLLPALAHDLHRRKTPTAHPRPALDSSGPDAADEGDDLAPSPAEPRIAAAVLSGAEPLGRVVLVDQSLLGKTPRSNPAVYIGAFEHIRELFAQCDLARQRGLKNSAFSFNSAQGQCQRCRGAGFEKIEMQFLSDVFIRCPECDGRRYRPHILEIKLSAAAAAPGAHSWSIADLLQATVDEVIRFLADWAEVRPAQRAVQSLRLLQEVGLGYLRLGQPINTLSGGESQRLKLVSHLAEFAEAESQEQQATLFLFDEPTTGLHFDDVRVLLGVFQRLVDRGHSVLVIEHNLDVIKCADWLIDLGPEAGEQGGRIVVQGTPEEVAAAEGSHTGRALREWGLPA